MTRRVRPFRNVRDKLQHIAGDAGHIPERVVQTDARHRAVGWYLEPVGGEPLYLGYHERDAIPHLVRWLDRQPVS